LPYEEILISLQNKPQWYKAVVPTGLVPAVLFHENDADEKSSQRTLIWESEEILKALDERFPGSKKLMQSTLEFQAAMDLQERLQTVGVRFLYDKRNFTADEMSERKKQFEDVLDELDEALGKARQRNSDNNKKLFRLGQEVSGVDVVMAPTLERWRYQLPISEGLDITKNRQHLQTWFGTMDAFAPYAHRVAGDRYSWTATAAMFLRYFACGDDQPHVKEGMERAESAAKELVRGFSSSKYFNSCDDDAAAFALAAAEKLISNHDLVLDDSMSHEPKSQQNLPRASDRNVADTVLRYIASILLDIASMKSPIQSPLEVAMSIPLVHVADKKEGTLVLRTVATRLCVPRDMGAPSASIFRGVLSTIADRLESDSMQSVSHRAAETRVCVIHDEDLPGICSFEATLDLAKALNAPLFSASEWLNDQRSFTCALRFVPYEYGDNLNTHALAVVTLPPGNKRRRPEKTKKKLDDNVFFVDLCPSSGTKAGRRGKRASGTPDLLLKAVQPHKGTTGLDVQGGCVVYDLTAGLGQDSLILAMNGAKQVYMVERHPIVFALLEDALRRLHVIASSRLSDNCSQEDKERYNLASFLVGKLSLWNADSKDWLLEHHGLGGDGNVVIYLDPMFPSRQKSAAVKKGMAVLHDLLESQHGDFVEGGNQQEELELLQLALNASDTRVVVKRPIRAPLLGVGVNDTPKDLAPPPKPSYSIDGSVNRWDVYVKAKK
jgi:16S rRNA (guanine1516-N2)-methyltransferase